MQEAPVVIFFIYGCPFCQKSLRLLKQKKVPYKAVNLGNKPKLAHQLAAKFSHRTVPKIFVNGQFIGGSKELESLLNH